MLGILGPLFVSASDESLFNLDIKQAKLPFEYHRSQSHDHLSLVYSGGYKVYEIAESSREVAVIGPLRPCIGVVVTDGLKVVVFHKHCSNSLDSMGDILAQHLDFSNQQEVCACIYTTKDEKEWEKNNRQKMHGGKSHRDEVLSIKDFLDKKMGIIRANIDAGLKPLRNGKGEKIYSHLEGRYNYAITYVSIRLNDLFESLEGDRKGIKFFSIDPVVEDIFSYKGSKMTRAEEMGPEGVEDFKRENSDISEEAVSQFLEETIEYDEIVEMYKKHGNLKGGYGRLLNIFARHQDKMEENLYLRFFGKTPDNLFISYALYNSLDFYPL